MSKRQLVVFVEIALTLALGVVLGSLKIWQMPQGGSISLGMLPVLVLALRRGPLVGVAAGALGGLLGLIVEPPFIVHPVQFILDYPVAFAAVGLAGLFSASWRSSARTQAWSRGIALAVIPGVATGALLRYAAHVVSGIVYFADYAQGQPVILYSAIYNSYVLVSALLCMGAAILVLPALERVVPSENERS
ncbi:MAG: proton-coupled thiamine transporter [Actinobacteria bacterium]|nr:MAG: proton-coupled thiamine transporter [Actinomycetota bacterium]